jgi:pilus assembly protein FimV
MVCASGSALALTFGQVSVESGIGQPLRVAIEITQYKVEDLRKLTLRLAPAASFEQAQMVFHPALNGLETRLEFRGEGKPFVALTGLTPVNEHFIDVIVEAQWPSGRLARNYTLLVSPVGGTPTQPANTQTRFEVIAPVASGTALAAAANPASARDKQPSPETVTVRAGDTASRLLVRPLPEGVTLDQMLLAMVRANPEAFIEGNVNLLREGAQVQLPNTQEALHISAEEAQQTLVAQTVDFVAYAQRLAQSPPQAPDTASREMSGKLSANAPTQAAQLTAKDSLTLSKREAGGNTDEARLAVEREIQDKTEQLAALQKNLDTLKSLSASQTMTDKTQAPVPTALLPPSPNLPLAATPAQPSSLLEQLSRSSAVGLWVMALLGGMLAWVWLARRRPSSGEDLFAQNPPNASREPGASFKQIPHKARPGEHAPLPLGLPPQFANLDLNLTPTPDSRSTVEASPPAGPKT